MKLTRKLAKIKEPVMLGAAIVTTVDAATLLAGIDTAAQTVVHGVAAVWIAWVVRGYTTPTKDVEQQVEVGKYVGAVEHQATSLAARQLARPLAARRE